MSDELDYDAMLHEAILYCADDQISSDLIDIQAEFKRLRAAVKNQEELLMTLGDKVGVQLFVRKGETVEAAKERWSEMFPPREKGA